jgi:hypothetical protein
MFLVLSAVWTSAQETGKLVGRIEDRTYIGPNGDYSVVIPVLPELGGTVSDTPTVAVFRDDYNVHVSLGAFPQDATQRWELSTRGIKEYLPMFFTSFVMPDFQQMFPGIRVENAVFQPNRLNGALICYTLMPGGSMFVPEVGDMGTEAPPPVAKRGNLLFVHNHTVFVISVELTERTLEGTLYRKTTEEEDAILRARLDAIVSAMRFAKTAE